MVFQAFQDWTVSQENKPMTFTTNQPRDASTVPRDLKAPQDQLEDRASAECADQRDRQASQDAMEIQAFQESKGLLVQMVTMANQAKLERKALTPRNPSVAKATEGLQARKEKKDHKERLAKTVHQALPAQQAHQAHLDSKALQDRTATKAVKARLANLEKMQNTAHALTVPTADLALVETEAVAEEITAETMLVMAHLALAARELIASASSKKHLRLL